MRPEFRAYLILTGILLAGFLMSSFKVNHLPETTDFGPEDDGTKKKFNVSSPISGNNSVLFEYFCPYPGVTRVKLMDTDGEVLWRDQYNNNEGKHKVSFKKEYLESGVTYTFQFEYKFDTSRHNYTAP